VNRAAFEKEVINNQEPLRRFLLNLCGGDSALSDDIAQEAFIKAYLNINSFNGLSKFSTWLYRIVYNAAVSKTRKKKMEFVAMNEAIIQNYTESEITERVDHLDENDQRALMERAVRRLPEEDHLLVTLFYHADHSIDEISYITGLSASNVKVRLHRIRKRLYEEISEMMKAEMV